MRTIVLHYHLFKNAGTSLDRILQQNFGERWLTAEFPANGGDNSALVSDWIRSTPEGAAYSSHTMLGPLPRVEGVQVVPVLLLRDPIDRIRSAYRFERDQVAETWGAQLAKQHDLEGYVRARLQRRGDRQCRNFQTERLASMAPGGSPELERAVAALRVVNQEGVVGLVENFDSTLRRLAAKLEDAYPDFAWTNVRANVSKRDTDGDRDGVTQLLQAANEDDNVLLREARLAAS